MYLTASSLKLINIFLNMTKEVSFKVGMTCVGCKGAVLRILQKIEGKMKHILTK